ncbi:MAG: hypothetical protein RLZ98_1657 [Pseudomonadota bacterium]|jgi:predicted metal-dependent enzyme (double-stranded beta helix superfamily)
MGERLPAFQAFIDDLRKIWAKEPNLEACMRAGQARMRELVMNDALLEASKSWPSTEGQNLFLYEDPDHGFYINAVVRVPGRTGSVHDHADAWVVYGVMDGTESLERFERTDDGSRPGHAEVRMTSVTQGKRGSVDIVGPWEIHAEQGGPARSVAMILRSKKLVGEVLQNRFDLKTGKVTLGSGPEQVPFNI